MSRDDEFALRVDLAGASSYLSLYVAELLERLGPAVEMPEDPLAALLQSQSEPAERPSDPVMGRLLPDGVLDDEEAAVEFRRFSHVSLLERKRQDATFLLTLLKQGGGVIDRAETMSVLGGLNDVRLMLGTKLMLTQDQEFEPETSEEEAAYQAYHVASLMQEELVGALESTVGPGTS
jgi:hypothetical protein